MSNENGATPTPVQNLLTGLRKDEQSNLLEVKEEIEVEEEAGDSQASDEIKDSLVTEELAEMMKLPKGFIGKPLSQIGASYKESVRWANTSHEKLTRLETEVNTLKSQLTASETKKIEEQATRDTKTALGNVPDPTTEPDEFAKWIEKRDELIEARILKALDKKSLELAKSIEENPHIKLVQEQAIERAEAFVYSQLKEQLPKEMKVEDVLNSWIEANEDDYEDMVKKGVYKENPRRLVKDVLTWLKAVSYDSLKNKKDSETTKEIHKRTKSNLEKAIPKKFTPTLINRKEEKEGGDTVASRIANKLRRQQGLAPG